VLDYPSFQDEIDIIDRVDSGVYDEEQPPVATLDDVLFLQKLAADVYLDASIKNYIVSAVYVTRHADKYLPAELASCIEYGASPRASIAFARAARALALLEGRTHVIPEDVKTLRYVILRHRVILGFEAIAREMRPETIIDAVFAAIPAP
jgi:MoxR-like ATPase